MLEIKLEWRPNFIVCLPGLSSYQIQSLMHRGKYVQGWSWEVPKILGNLGTLRRVGGLEGVHIPISLGDPGKYLGCVGYTPWDDLISGKNSWPHTQQSWGIAECVPKHPRKHRAITKLLGIPLNMSRRFWTILILCAQHVHVYVCDMYFIYVLQSVTTLMCFLPLLWGSFNAGNLLYTSPAVY